MLYWLRLFALIFLLPVGCTKSSVKSEIEKDYQLAYKENIYYLNDSEYKITPVKPRPGQYSAFPDNLNIDPGNGDILISLKDNDGKESQMGLKYQVYFRSNDGQINDTTELTLAGINYQDIFLEENNNDSILLPNFQNSGPEQNRFVNFVAADKKLIIDGVSGAINLLRSTRNGFFGDRPENQDWKQVKVFYEDIHYPKVKHEIELVIYFYTSLSEVPSNVSEAMRAHQSLLVDIAPVNIPVTAAPIDKSISGIISPRKPRPPCIVIVGK